MQAAFQEILLKSTGAKSFQLIEEIQSLWSGYGMISRYALIGGEVNSVVVKHVKFPNQNNHPRGWNSNLSHQRKVKSYHVESNWYQRGSELCDESCRIPKCFAIENHGDDVFIILEDLDASGFGNRIQSANLSNAKLCLKWLASFHAKYLFENTSGLWGQGTYWHLATRPEELEVLEDQRLKQNASKIDLVLQAAVYKTLVHGDAKLANFCFSDDEQKVAGVDFQYIGSGCGMKDVVYFIGSCFYEEDCKEYESELLDAYFKELKMSIQLNHSNVNADEVELEWRNLFDVAWADFHRFLKGWSPGHWKINSYSEVLTEKVLDKVEGLLSKKDLYKLSTVANETAEKAGFLIEELKQRGFTETIKDSNLSEAAQVVTEVDEKVQAYILSALQSTMEAYPIGLLTEESSDDGSRFSQPYFWCIDPLDGTLPFTKNRSGYSVSIALVTQSGKCIVAAVYDPVEQKLFSSVLGQGAYINGKRIDPAQEGNFELITDNSFTSSDEKELVLEWMKELSSDEFYVVQPGGAVMNALSVLDNKKACYLKLPKERIGGGSIWDFAATSLIVQEAGGYVSGIKNRKLALNEQSAFMNTQGVLYTGSGDVFQFIQSKL